MHDQLSPNMRWRLARYRRKAMRRTAKARAEEVAAVARFLSVAGLDLTRWQRKVLRRTYRA